MPLDDETKKFITEAITTSLTTTEAERNKGLQTLVHSAVATHLKDSRPKMVEDLKGILTELVPNADALKTQIGEALKAAQEETAKKPGGNQPPAGPTPEVAALTRQVNELTTKLKNEGEARATAEKKQRDDAAFATMRTHLSAKVRPEMLDTLAKVLFHADQRVSFGEDGAPLFKIKRAPMPGLSEADELLPLESGIAEFLKSKDAEPFLPAPNGGSGGKRPAAPGRTPIGTPTKTYDRPATTDAEKVRRAGERETELAAQFPHLAR